ncbi:MAG TPA: T9SS type A sorting domain-containing protein, partial [Saprospiraceae bacterium]|nr:T9SS type A sorting domain-containing protein [Saprospiraceae bacterium]
TNYKDFAQTNSIIEDQIPSGTSYVPGSSNLPPTVGNTLVFSLPAIQPDSSFTITYALSTLPQNHSIQLIYDDIENSPEDRWDIYSDAGNTTDLWFSQDAVVHSGISAWGVGDPAAESKQILQNYDPYPITGNLPVYRFYHYYDTEAGADGGFLEITTNNGQSWASLAPHIFRNGYPGKLQYGTFAIPNLYAFSGQSALNFKMIPVYIDLSDYKGENVKIRYRFGSNATNSKDGWYVDDVELMDAVIYNAQACFMSDQSNALCVEAPERGTIVDSEVTVGTQDQQASFPFEIMPNPAGDIVQTIVTAHQNGTAQVQIFDLTGHLVMHATWNLSEGLNQKAFDITNIAPGMYVIQVENAEGTVSKKFIKE